MLKLWIRLIRDNKLTGQFTAPVKAASAADMLAEGLREGCYELDLAQPMVQEKHLKDIRQYGFTRFLPESFMEDVSFDRMEVRIFDDKQKNKK